MPKGSFQHQHEHETCIRFNLDILEERKYLWSQTLCQCLVRSVTTVSSLMIGPSVEFQTVIGCFSVALQIWSYPHIASHGIRIWWTCSVCSAYRKSRVIIGSYREKMFIPTFNYLKLACISKRGQPKVNPDPKSYKFSSRAWRLEDWSCVPELWWSKWRQSGSVTWGPDNTDTGLSLVRQRRYWALIGQ